MIDITDLFQAGGFVEHAPAGVDARDGEPDAQRDDVAQDGEREASGHRRTEVGVDVVDVADGRRRRCRPRGWQEASVDNVRQQVRHILQFMSW